VNWTSWSKWKADLQQSERYEPKPPWRNDTRNGTTHVILSRKTKGKQCHPPLLDCPTEFIANSLYGLPGQRSKLQPPLNSNTGQTG
jgi:hypothetical protein